MILKKLSSRRLFLRAGATAIMAGAMRPAIAAVIRLPSTRSLSFENLHTGERLKVDYCVNGSYSRDALHAVDKVLRDFRTGDIHTIDYKLLDLLSQIVTTLETSQPVQVISGYRSPTTNAMLHEASSGVAAKSLHMQGKAIDIRMPGCPLNVLHKTALALRSGGVGYYPKSNFVHVDVGRVRTW